jgi:flavin-dependent dehydrogenase
MRVVVIGGSIAGLTAGLALCRQGHQVTILERDAQPIPDSPDEAASSWRRGGIPQVHQGHGFISRARSELVTHAPDLWQDLLDAGATELPLIDQRRGTLDDFDEVPGDAQDAFLLCRRTTFEWVLRRAAERECAVRLGVKVGALLTDASSARPRATGVATSDGPLAADLVVDASGRSGGLAHRVRDAGGSVDTVEDEACGLVYATRFYRLRDGAEAGPLNRIWAAGGTFSGYSSSLFPADNRTFSVGFGRLPADDELKAAHTTDGFERALARIPNVADWVDPERSEPLGPAVPMAGIHNMLTLVSGISGLVAIGDAVCTTDPSFGRGAAIALAAAFELGDAVADSAGDVDAIGERYDAWFVSEVLPWHADAVRSDRGRTAMWEAAIASSRATLSGDPPQAPRSPPSPEGSLPPVHPSAVAAAGLTGPDVEVWRAFVAYAGLLAPPASLMTEDIVERVRRMTAEGWTPPDPGALSHREMVEAVSA